MLKLYWNKKFDEAKVFYTGLVERNLIILILGFANTLSNLKI
jgi:hypothetical protein